MRLAIMQPYFLPYIGFFQLIATVEQFVVYDNIKYTKKGWINRNRMLQNGKDMMFSLPLKSGSDSLHICERELAPDFKRAKLINQFMGAYRRAPYFAQIFPLIEHIVLYADTNLFRYLHHSIVKVCEYLEIRTEIIKSSDIDIDHNLKNQEKVLALCKALGAHTYVNAIGGVELYSKSIFKDKGIELKFIRSRLVEYQQFGNDFVPWLSIIDVLMFNSRDQVRAHITDNCDLI